MPDTSAAPGVEHSLCRSNAPYRIEVGGALTTAGLVRDKHVLTVLDERRWTLRRGTAAPGGPPVARRYPHALVAPALEDAHVHLHPGMALPDFVAYGICRIRDLGSTAGTEQPVPAARHCGDPIPEIVLGGPLLDRPGKPRLDIATRWEKAQELPAVVEAAAARGASWIKLYAQFPEELISAVVREAHTRNLRVAVHPGPGGAPAAVCAGVDEVEHVACLAPRGDGSGGAHALHRRWAQRDGDTWSQRDGDTWSHCDGDTWSHCDGDSWPHLPAGTGLCPTLVVQHRLAEEAARSWSFPDADPATAAFWRRMRLVSRPWTEQELRHCRMAGAEMSAVVARLVRQGVRLVPGSDTPNPGVLPGRGLWEELNLLVEAGLAPLEVMAAAVGGAGLDSSGSAGLDRSGSAPVTLLPLASFTAFHEQGRYPIEPVIATLLRGCLFVPRPDSSGEPVRGLR